MPTDKENKNKWLWKLNNDNVNLDGLNPNLIAYLNTLEPEYQEMLIATSGTDSTHSKTSRHYKKNAVDLALPIWRETGDKSKSKEDKLFQRIAQDPLRLKYGITLLDPNHGSAPHLHLSIGNGTENKKDVWVDPHSPKAKEIIKNTPKPKELTWDDLKKQKDFSKYVPNFSEKQKQSDRFRFDVNFHYKRKRNEIKNNKNLSESEKAKEYDKLNMAMYHEGYLNIINDQLSSEVYNKNKNFQRKYNEGVLEVQALTNFFNYNNEVNQVGELLDGNKITYDKNKKPKKITFRNGNYVGKGDDVDYFDIFKNVISKNPELGKVIQGEDSPEIIEVDATKFLKFYQEKLKEYSKNSYKLLNDDGTLALNIDSDFLSNSFASLIGAEGRTGTLDARINFVPKEVKYSEYNKIKKNEAWDAFNIYADETNQPQDSNVQDQDSNVQDADTTPNTQDDSSTGTDDDPTQEEDTPESIKELASDFLGTYQEPDDFVYDPDNYKKDLPIESFLANSVNAIIGSKMANTDLPLRDETVSDALIRHANELKMISEQGLSPEEEVARKKLLNESYQTSLDAYARQSNGNRNIVLANLGNLDQAKMNQLTEMSLADEERRMDAFIKHGQALKDIDQVRLNKEIANHAIRYEQAENEIEAGAELMGNAMGALIGDIQHYKETKPGSFTHALESYHSRKLLGVDTTLKDQDDESNPYSVAGRNKKINEQKRTHAQVQRAMGIIPGLNEASTQAMNRLLDMGLTQKELAQSIEELSKIDTNGYVFNEDTDISKAYRENNYSSLFSPDPKSKSMAESTTTEMIQNIRSGNEHLINIGGSEETKSTGLKSTPGTTYSYESLFGNNVNNENINFLSEFASTIFTPKELEKNGVDFNFQDKSNENLAENALRVQAKEDKAKLEILPHMDEQTANLIRRANELPDYNKMVQDSGVLQENQFLINTEIQDPEALLEEQLIKNGFNPKLLNKTT